MARNEQSRQQATINSFGRVHFHSSDDRFCGSTLPMREFSFDAAKVNCPACRPLAAEVAVGRLECAQAQ